MFPHVSYYRKQKTLLTHSSFHVIFMSGYLKHERGGNTSGILSTLRQNVKGVIIMKERQVLESSLFPLRLKEVWVHLYEQCILSYVKVRGME